MTDPVEQAITATERLVQVQITLPSGKHAMLAVPADLSAEDTLGLIGGVTNVYVQVKAQRPASRIILPA